jgi:hypothetical protein
MKPETSTERIGQTELSVRIPKPDFAPIATPSPEPRESTKGTVTFLCLVTLPPLILCGAVWRVVWEAV